MCAGNAKSEHFVFLHPGKHLRPAVFGRFLAVARPVVGVESVRRAGIDLELGGFLGRCECRLHGLDLLDRNALVGRAIETKDRRLHFGRKLGRALRPQGGLRRRIDE